MKSIRLFLACLLALIVTLPQASCTGTPEQRAASLSRLANLALNVAVVSGRITPTQAAIVKQAGALVFEAASNREVKVEEISTLIVATAVETGALTPTQAEQLAAAERVPLNPPASALPTP